MAPRVDLLTKTDINDHVTVTSTGALCKVAIPLFPMTISIWRLRSRKRDKAGPNWQYRRMATREAMANHSVLSRRAAAVLVDDYIFGYWGCPWTGALSPP